MRIALMILALTATTCGGRDEISSEVKRAVADTRTKPQVTVILQIDDDEVRKAVERRIEEQHIGIVKSESSGPGHLDFVVEVDSSVDAIPRIRDVIRAAGVFDKATIRVSS